jgi:hypothetical protein
VPACCCLKLVRLRYCLVCVLLLLQLLPGGSRALYELWADLGELLLKGGSTAPGAWVQPD